MAEQETETGGAGPVAMSHQQLAKIRRDYETARQGVIAEIQAVGVEIAAFLAASEPVALELQRRLLAACRRGEAFGVGVKTIADAAGQSLSTTRRMLHR